MKVNVKVANQHNDDFDKQISSMAVGNDLMMDDIVAMMDHEDEVGDDEYAETPMGPVETPNGFDDEKVVESGGERLGDNGQEIVMAASYKSVVSSMNWNGNQNGNDSDYKMDPMSPSTDSPVSPISIFSASKSPKLMDSAMRYSAKRKLKNNKTQVF